MADEMAHITCNRVCERDKSIMNEALLLLPGPHRLQTTCREISDLGLGQKSPDSESDEGALLSCLLPDPGSRTPETDFSCSAEMFWRWQEVHFCVKGGITISHVRHSKELEASKPPRESGRSVKECPCRAGTCEKRSQSTALHCGFVCVSACVPSKTHRETAG